VRNNKDSACLACDRNISYFQDFFFTKCRDCIARESKEAFLLFWLASHYLAYFYRLLQFGAEASAADSLSLSLSLSKDS
jgi:hypothetical protein